MGLDRLRVYCLLVYICIAYTLDCFIQETKKYNTPSSFVAYLSLCLSTVFMENTQSSPQIIDKDSSISIPRGGPIFQHDLITPLTRVPVFESQVVCELQSLNAELHCAFNDLQEEEDEDISLDELKIYSDEELVSEAMKVAFEDDQGVGNPFDMPINPCTSGVEDDHRMTDLGTSPACESSNGLSSEASQDKAKDNKSKNSQKRKSKNNKKRKSTVCQKEKHIDESYLAKVEHLAKIRQKQEDDKASVKLHSFNQGKENTTVLSSGNVATLKFLEQFGRPVKGKCLLTEKHVPIRHPEVVLCVEIYHNKRPLKKTQEFLVLGCQTLTELREEIRCVTDVIMQKAGEHDPSGYFLIEDFFCNDTRDPLAVNYSEPIFDWLRNSKEEALAKWNCLLSGSGKARKLFAGDKPEVPNLPNFRSVNMQSTRFCDLEFRLGAGYLYCHQGDCKHIIVIRDMRLINPEDVQNRSAYPLLVYQLKALLKKCAVCHIYKATKVTVDDKLAGENPCYFCDNCYYLLHYSEHGTLLYDQFSVHDFIQD